MHNAAYRLVQRAHAEIADGTWSDDILPVPPADRPRALVAPIAAGGWVIASSKSPLYQELRQRHSDVVAVEMEGHGFLEAAYENGVDAAVVRGISDLVDDKAAADAEGSQERAAAHAAAMACRLLARLPPRG